LITGHSEAGLEARAVAAGAAGFLEKPFETNDLIRCIEAALEQACATSSNRNQP